MIGKFSILDTFNLPVLFGSIGCAIGCVLPSSVTADVCIVIVGAVPWSMEQNSAATSKTNEIFFTSRTLEFKLS
jgi:hypothetical protein